MSISQTPACPPGTPGDRAASVRHIAPPQGSRPRVIPLSHRALRNSCSAKHIDYALTTACWAHFLVNGGKKSNLNGKCIYRSGEKTQSHLELIKVLRLTTPLLQFSAFSPGPGLCVYFSASSVSACVSPPPHHHHHHHNTRCPCSSASARCLPVPRA